MRYYFILFVWLQSNIVSRTISEDTGNQTTLPTLDINEDINFNTDSQIITVSNTDILVTEMASSDVTTESLTSDESVGFTKPTEITDIISTTIMTTSENEDKNESTYAVTEDQTVPMETRTSAFEEGIVSRSEVSDTADTTQNIANTDTTLVELLSPTESTLQRNPSGVQDVTNETASSAVDDSRSAPSDEASLVHLEQENSSRVSEDTTIEIEEQETPSTVANKIKLLCQTIEDCPPDMLCVSILNACECLAKSKESNLIPCNGSSINTLSAKENAENELEPLAYRKLINLSPSELSECVSTVAFTPSIEIVEWFQLYDGKFKTFLASRLAVAWDKLINETVRFPNFRNNILYVTPSPLQEEGSIVVSFLVQNPFADSSDIFHQAEDVLDCLRVEWDELESELNLNVSYMKVGFPFEAIKTCSNKVLGNLNESEVKLLFLSMLVTATCALLAAIVAIAMQCKARRSRFSDLSPMRRLPYRHPGAVLIRSPGDGIINVDGIINGEGIINGGGIINGHDLATDQQCQEEEEDRGRWLASHSRGDGDDADAMSEKAVMAEIKGPKKDINAETPF